MAFPSAEPNFEYVELYREKTSNGSLVYLGPAETSKMVRKELVTRKGCPTSSFPTCGTKHGASNDLCSDLVASLYSDPNTVLGLSPRQICRLNSEGDDPDHCCVSWSKAVKNLTKIDLADAANSLMNKCVSNGNTGKMDNVLLEGVCATVCLSNRGTDCA